MTTDPKQPAANGYYWLVQPRLQTGIVFVRDGYFYIPGRLFARKVARVQEAEWHGPLQFKREVKESVK